MEKRRDIQAWLLVGAVLLLVGFAVWSVIEPAGKSVTLFLGDGVFKTRLAMTDAEIERGLSGTKKLSQDQAMLFVYQRAAKWPIWMKDMYYPLDIVWLDEQKRVVSIVKNAPPESYPQRFTPSEPALYVVELAAGTVDSRAIHVGSRASFDLEQLSAVRL